MQDRIVLQRVLLACVRAYQLAISPLLGPTCRFYPTCSTYAVEAIEMHGAWRGVWMTAKRILKCHPFHPGGVDLVPGTESRHRLDA